MGQVSPVEVATSLPDSDARSRARRPLSVRNLPGTVHGQRPIPLEICPEPALVEVYPFDPFNDLCVVLEAVRPCLRLPSVFPRDL